LPEFTRTGSQPLSKTAEVSQTAPDELELDSITEPSGYPEVTGDPLETKLALADEFKAIGDEDGARALIEEVLAEATGDVKARAQRALSQL
jgi:pilus assembly protein FimV